MTDAQLLARIKKEQARQAKGLPAKMVCYANGIARDLEEQAKDIAEKFPDVGPLTPTWMYCFRNLCKSVDVQGVECCVIFNASTLNYELWLGHMPEGMTE